MAIIANCRVSPATSIQAYVDLPLSLTKPLTFCTLGNFSCFCHRLLNFTKLTSRCFFLEHYQSVVWFVSRSGSKLFAKVISSQQGKSYFLSPTPTTPHISPELEYFPLLFILNTSCLQKWPRQTAQTQIRLLLKKQSDQGLHYLLF